MDGLYEPLAMYAYIFHYTHVANDGWSYKTTKVARDEKTAFKYAFGCSQKKNEKMYTTKRGLRIILNKVEQNEVSKIFRITPIPKKEPTREVSDTGDWML